MTESTCTVSGCDKHRHGRGLCQKHYTRLIRTGSTESRIATADHSAADRLAARVVRRGPDDCWLWQGGTGVGGYGQLRVNGRRYLAHRLAYELSAGPIPPDVRIDHRCREPLCCNPRHLRLATIKQNAENLGVNAKSTTGVRGVWWSSRDQVYEVGARHNGHRYHGGCFKTLAEAEAAVIALRNRLYTHNEADRIA